MPRKPSTTTLSISHSIDTSNTDEAPGRGRWEAKFNTAMRQCEMAHNYEHGLHGFRKNPAKAFELYSSAFKSQPTERSAIALGHYYANGIGTEKDDDKSLYYYKYAALTLNSAGGKFQLAVMFLDGIYGVVPNPYLGIKYMEKAAEQGFIPAMDNLCSYYRKGLHVPQDPLKAVEYMEMMLAYGKDMIAPRLFYMYMKHSAESSLLDACHFIKKVYCQDHAIRRVAILIADFLEHSPRDPKRKEAFFNFYCQRFEEYEACAGANKKHGFCFGRIFAEFDPSWDFFCSACSTTCSPP